MISIKEKLDSLPSNKRKELYLAFENQEPYYVELKDGTYVGVNCKGIKHLIVEEEVGIWSTGHIEKSKTNGRITV
jgi:phage-related protein